MMKTKKLLSILSFALCPFLISEAVACDNRRLHNDLDRFEELAQRTVEKALDSSNKTRACKHLRKAEGRMKKIARKNPQCDAELSAGVTRMKTYMFNTVKNTNSEYNCR